MERRNLMKRYAGELQIKHMLGRYPDIRDRKAWEGLSEELRRRLVAAGDAFIDFQWPQLLASDYMEFSENGNRSHFQDKMFARRTALNALVLAECVENQGRFIKQILDGLFLMLEESTWCLPAHNSYIRDTKQFPLPDYDRPVIDLFQAETGSVVAVAEYLLRPVFEEITPFISKDVNHRIRERIIEPYLNSHFWWMGNGKEPMNNWTVWCTQNVLLSIFTRPEGYLSEECKTAVLEKALASVDYFLDEYGEDGCCDEGAQYYGHAGLTLFNCLELLNELTEGGVASVYQEPVVQNIAAYILKVYVGKQNYINFADCSPKAGRRGAREYLFGKACGNRAMMAFAAKDYRESEDQLQLTEQNLYYRVQQAFARDEMMRMEELALPTEDVWFESVGLLIARDGCYTLAAKAGDNGDSHNHNDTGSFTIYKNGEPLLIDLGVETYTQKTFSDRRYEIWTMQSQYHNLPSFYDAGNYDLATLPEAEEAARMQKAGDKAFVMEHDGEQYAAAHVQCVMEQDRAGLSMELAGAYGDARIRSYQRQVSLQKGEGIQVTDHYDGTLTGVLSLISYEKPELELKDGSAETSIKISSGETAKAVDGLYTQRIRIGALGCVEVEGTSEICIETCPITDERLQTAWKHDCYRILLKFAGRDIKLRIC